MKENIKAPRHWPLCGEFTGDQWITQTNGTMSKRRKIKKRIIEKPWKLTGNSTAATPDKSDTDCVNINLICWICVWWRLLINNQSNLLIIKRKHFPRYWPFMRGIHRSPVNSPHKGRWREALMFPLIWAWTNGWANNRDTGDLRRHGAHDVIEMSPQNLAGNDWSFRKWRPWFSAPTSLGTSVYCMNGCNTTVKSSRVS